MRSPRPITSRGRCLRNSIASFTRASNESNSRRLGRCEQRAQVDAQHLAGRLGLGHAHIGAGRERRRLAVGEVDDADFVAGVDQRWPACRRRRFPHRPDGRRRRSHRVGRGWNWPWCVHGQLSVVAANSDGRMTTATDNRPILPEFGRCGEGPASILDKWPPAVENSGLPRAAELAAAAYAIAGTSGLRVSLRSGGSA